MDEIVVNFKRFETVRNIKTIPTMYLKKLKYSSDLNKQFLKTRLKCMNIAIKCSGKCMYMYLIF